MGGVRLGVRCCAICVALALLPLCIQGHTGGSSSSWNDSAGEMAEKVAEMFYHSYRGYMTHAFPHDELKPLSKSYSDSLGELGNLDLEHLTEGYQGVALTLIDSLSTLAILGNASEFERQVWWVCDSVSFDLDVRVNVFEANIRLLGGLLSAHSLAADPQLQLIQHRRYNDELLHLALDLGERLLPAFSESPTGIPFGWVNLRHGVRRGETTETNTAAVGSLILEHGMLSRLTGDPRFEEAALRALLVLWELRSGTTGLWGTALCMSTLRWLSPVAGTGPSADSFYEYLLKAYLLFGDERYWELFQDAYRVSLQHLRDEGGWYQDVEIVSGEVTYRQMVSLQAFWPGMQVLAGDLELAQETFLQFFSVWRQYHLLPERFLYRKQLLHPTERSYQLRPELIESLYYLYRATRRKEYRMAGTIIYDSLQDYTKVEGGHAVIRDVVTMLKEDHMPSFFLAETCMYLYLLFDDSSFAHDERWLFTTEGHPLPIDARIHDQTRMRLGSDRDVFGAAKAFAVKQRQRILEPRRRSGWSSATQTSQQSDATYWPLAPGTVIHDVAQATAQSLVYSTPNSDGESAQSAQGSIAALVSAVMASLQRAQGGASDSGMVDLEGTSGFQRIVFHAPGGVEFVLEPGGGVGSSRADPDEDGVDAQPQAWTENQLVVQKSGRLTRVELSRTSWGSEDEAFVEGYDEQTALQPADDEAALEEGEECDVEWATAHRAPDLRHRRTMAAQPSMRREGDHPKQGSIGTVDAGQSMEAGWGQMGSKLAALDVRMCINFDYGSTRGSQPPVRSLCHVQDHAEDHRCTSHGQCGVDRWVCRNRVCSNAGYCTTVR